MAQDNSSRRQCPFAGRQFLACGFLAQVNEVFGLAEIQRMIHKDGRMYQNVYQIEPKDAYELDKPTLDGNPDIFLRFDIQTAGIVAGPARPVSTATGLTPIAALGGCFDVTRSARRESKLRQARRRRRQAPRLDG
jgi:hypothetical protein